MRRQHTSTSGSTVGMVIYLTLIAGVIACFAGGLTVLLSPANLQNPGMSAYHPSAALALLPTTPPPEAPPLLESLGDDAPPSTAAATTPAPKTDTAKADAKTDGKVVSRRETRRSRRTRAVARYDERRWTDREARASYYQPWF
jgi:hypothetical protein